MHTEEVFQNHQTIRFIQPNINKRKVRMFCFQVELIYHLLQLNGRRIVGLSIHCVTKEEGFYFMAMRHCGSCMHSVPSLKNLLGIRRFGQEGEKIRRAWSHRARFLGPVKQTTHRKWEEFQKHMQSTIWLHFNSWTNVMFWSPIWFSFFVLKMIS